MRAVIQRVKKASVSVEEKIVGKINQGIVVLLGITHDDTEEDAKYLAEKITNLRIFEDENNKLNLSLLDIKGKILSVSQFTLYGDCRKGRRPSFTEAAYPKLAEELYNKFNQYLEGLNIEVEKGVFQAYMQVEIINDGPVTILLESKKIF
ncbi:MAG: D-tyrosyl-tRNA(Tyr) deacylase [Clostridiaceae bacterium BRH_c20a]|nr:MAG: D-tyrosyl-tRNA(Tyr) deacylase [Clostridiaceae bacterium BRH_c20a]KJS21165.1 MAG: D-tyrosyl-tRNA(Tyr) deacylase [Clostridiaceae bacterium BRH_c20a]